MSDFSVEKQNCDDYFYIVKILTSSFFLQR